MAPSLRPPPAAPAPPPLPALAPPRNPRRQMDPVADALIDALDRFVVEGGAVAGEQRLDISWDEILRFRSDLLHALEVFLDRFGPNLVAPQRPAARAPSERPVLDVSELAELVESLRPPG